jgi:hypothetical protein
VGKANSTHGCVMSDMDTLEDVAYCCRRAEEFKRMALHETDPKLKQSYSEMEERWLMLADCFRYPESINAMRAAIAAERADKNYH